MNNDAATQDRVVLRQGEEGRGERDGGSAIRSSLDVAKVARVSGIIGAPMIDIVGIVVSSEGRATGVGDHLPVLVNMHAVDRVCPKPTDGARHLKHSLTIRFDHGQGESARVGLS